MSPSARRLDSRTPRLPRLVLVIALSVGAADCARSIPRTHAPDPATRDASGDSIEVGYGEQARRDVIGSITRVDGDAVGQTAPTSLADMLEGRVPGLEVHRLPNGGMSVRIRGQRSFRADGEPLFVIDGVPKPSEGAYRDLDPRDIRSIEVLRDAGSLALYGSRGANGVILITTRRN